MKRDILKWAGIAVCGVILWALWPERPKLTEKERVEAILNSKMHLP
jgi:type II secretory pathway component PulM